MIFNLTGTPKMKIMAFSDTSFSQKAGEIIVQLNPDKYSLDYEVQFANTQSSGSSGQELLFDRIKPQRLNFDFLFDRTGAIPDSVAIPGLGGLPSLGGDIYSAKYLILN
jgi:hypothetical protein